MEVRIGDIVRPCFKTQQSLMRSCQRKAQNVKGAANLKGFTEDACKHCLALRDGVRRSGTPGRDMVEAKGRQWQSLYARKRTVHWGLYLGEGQMDRSWGSSQLRLGLERLQMTQMTCYLDIILEVMGTEEKN